QPDPSGLPAWFFPGCRIEIAGWPGPNGCRGGSPVGRARSSSTRTRAPEETRRRGSRPAKPCAAGEQTWLSSVISKGMTMSGTIKAGTILIEDGTLLPESLQLESEAYSTGWTSVSNIRSEFENTINHAGWTFFFMAGMIQATVFGFDKQKAVSTAVRRIITDVEWQKCNCLEITGVTLKSFLGVPYACVSAHSRHVQASPVFSG